VASLDADGSRVSNLVKTCPECAEEVRDAARICRECGHLFPTEAPPVRDRPRHVRRRRMTPRRRAIALLTANPWRVAALGLLAVLVLGAVIASGEESGSDERPGREELAVSFEGTLSGKLDQVKQDLRPALAEQGAAASAYRVKEGSTRCRVGDEAAPFRCVALLTNEQGFAFSLAYSVVSVEGGCWQAQPERVELANGRLVNTGGGNGGEGRPLDGCVSPEGTGEDSLPPPPSEAPDQAVDDSAPACDPSYPDVCIPPSPPELDCNEVEHSDFTVVKKQEDGSQGNDPHDFDPDGDGTGCETPLPESPEIPEPEPEPEPELPPTPDPAGAEEDYEYEKDVYEREGCSAETPEGCRG